MLFSPAWWVLSSLYRWCCEVMENLNVDSKATKMKHAETQKLKYS